MALATVGWVIAPAKPVEILIAASIALGATHAIRPIARRGEVAIAGVFGLVHGLAFAEILESLSLTGGSQVLTLLAFNVGVELAQLAAVAAVLPALYLLSRAAHYGKVRLTGTLSVLPERSQRVHKFFPYGATMNSKKSKLIALTASVVMLIGAAGVWWFFSNDPADEVSLEAATESVDTTSTASEDTDSTDTDSIDSDTPSDDLSGAWMVDTTTGEFDYESATGSFVGFRIEEELTGLGSTTAVGRTGDIEGGIVIDGTTVTEATFDIDLTTITTEDSRRDDNVQDALEVDEFPSASFVLTEPIELSTEALAGEAFAAPAIGQLTIHGTTQDIEMDLEAQLVQNTVVIVGTTNITFSDYGVQVPESQIVVSVEDFGVLELQLLLVR